MTKQDINDHVAETLLGTAILRKQEISTEFTEAEIAQYFALAQTPNSQVDEILAHTPSTALELLSHQQAEKTAARKVMVQAAAALAMNRNDSSDEHSQRNRTGIDEARSATLKRLQEHPPIDSLGEHAD